MTDAPNAHLLRTLAAVPPSARVLALGCGDGRDAEALARLGFDLWACDADPAHVEAARARVGESVGEGEAARRVTPACSSALGYPDDHFDWVAAVGAYDAAEDAAALRDMLAETKRVLAPGGWVFAGFVSEVVGPELTPDRLDKLFAEAGFAIAESAAEEEGVVRGIYRRVGGAVL